MESLPNKIMVIASDTKSLVNFRLDLLQAMVENGAQVQVLAPYDKSFAAVEHRLKELGVDLKILPIQNTGLNPLMDLRTIWHLRRCLKDFQPRCVFSYTIKPVIYGSLVAAWCRVPQIFSMMSGLGHLYTFQDLKTRLIRLISNLLYRLALRWNNRVFFQNPDDHDLFLALGLVRKEQTCLTPGSGVNLSQFPKTPLPLAKKLRFLFAGRLIQAKGIREYIEAVVQLGVRAEEAEFWVVGGTHDNPSQVDVTNLKTQLFELGIQYVPETNQILPVLQQAHVIVLPSYREGTPKVLLEALAVGRPIITTDVPGCRQVISRPKKHKQDAVLKGKNGFLVPAHDAYVLAEAFVWALDHPQELVTMGHESRQLAEKTFDVRLVNQVILDVMGCR